MDRFHVGRWKRWVCRRAVVGSRHDRARRADPDAGACGAGVSRNRRRGLAEEIRSRGDLPRPLRQRDRQPRHQAQRFDPARGLSGQSDQGDTGDRRSPLLRPFRHRYRRHAPRADDQRAGRRRAAGRLADHPATRQESVPVQRAHHRAQGQRGLPRALAGDASVEERDSQALSRPRLYRRRHLRRQRRSAISISTSRCAT